MGDDQEGHEGEGHEGGAEGGAEAFSEVVDGGVGFGDAVGVIGTHEAGDRERENELGRAAGIGGCDLGGERVGAGC